MGAAPVLQQLALTRLTLMPVVFYVLMLESAPFSSQAHADAFWWAHDGCCSTTAPVSAQAYPKPFGGYHPTSLQFVLSLMLIPNG